MRSCTDIREKSAVSTHRTRFTVSVRARPHYEGTFVFVGANERGQGAKRRAMCVLVWGELRGLRGWFGASGRVVALMGGCVFWVNSVYGLNVYFSMSQLVSVGFSVACIASILHDLCRRNCNPFLTPPPPPFPGVIIFGGCRCF